MVSSSYLIWNGSCISDLTAHGWRSLLHRFVRKTNALESLTTVCKHATSGVAKAMGGKALEPSAPLQALFLDSDEIG